VHLYSNHFEQAREQLSRQPKPLPKLVLDASVTDLFEFRVGHVAIEGYEPHAAIKAPVAV
jgi:thymidylate synthase